MVVGMQNFFLNGENKITPVGVHSCCVFIPSVVVG